MKCSEGATLARGLICGPDFSSGLQIKHGCCKKHDSLQPAATRRRALTLAAGGFFAAERNVMSIAKLKQANKK